MPLNKTKAVLAAALLFTAFAACAASPEQSINTLLRDEMAQYGIPGVAVAVSVRGQTTFYNQGVASKTTHAPVTSKTLFEIGSLSKTFTAALASYAVVQGRLDYSSSASQYLPELSGSTFDHVTLLNLATHTSGLPLQVPDEIKNDQQLMDYYRQWQPPATPASVRVYSNPGIGLLGVIAAKTLGQPFSTAMAQQLLTAFGLHNSYLHVPTVAMPRYAQGYDKHDAPVRVSPGMLDAEAYGIKSTSADLIRYLNINMRAVPVAPAWSQALGLTQQGYFTVGGYTQGLMWERYALPVTLDQLLAGNDSTNITQPQPLRALTPPSPAQRTAWYNKTASTNGFSAYAVFIPEEQTALIILANKAWPNAQRVETAWKILGLAGSGAVR
ncbi:class C beta-lactamase [Pseudomonas typographi]|uniref:class C beta-lactamase n=1 Tax=Pseudomonas typographi TaxID=2715964 RepID=UPI001686507D|nr:class C beta-lactamase [Pseudomonas typographi]MBD1587045.1 beta-lactamase [Pseudomonas typographi]